MTMENGNEDEMFCKSFQIDVAENTNGIVENNKPIPIIETDIENTVIESREGAASAITKPISLYFLSDSSFLEMYNEVEEELFAQGEKSEMNNLFSDIPKEKRYDAVDAVIAEMEQRLAEEKELRCKRNQKLLEKAHNNSEAIAVVEKYYGKGQQIDDLDSLGMLYAKVGYFFFDMAIKEASSCGITDGKAIYQTGIRLEKERREKKYRNLEAGSYFEEAIPGSWAC